MSVVPNSDITWSPMSHVYNVTEDNGITSHPGIQLEAILVPCLFAVIFVIGIIGNGTLIYIVSRYKGMRNTPNLYLVSLAAGDLLLLSVSVPVSSIFYTLPEWPFGSTMCKANEFLQTLSLGISVFTLTALSADRYSVIARPMLAHQASSGKRTHRVTALVWLLSTTLAIPDLFLSKLRLVSYGSGSTLKVCQIYPPSILKAHTMVRFVVYFAAPILAIVAFYALMARVLLQSSTKGFYGETSSSVEVEGIGSTQLHKQMQARKRVAKVVLSFVVVFITCWLPRHVYLLWYHYASGTFNMFWHVIKIVGFCLSYTNSCVNPFALYLLSRQFRQHYDRILFSRGGCRKGERGGANGTGGGATGAGGAVDTRLRGMGAYDHRNKKQSGHDDCKLTQFTSATAVTTRVT